MGRPSNKDVVRPPCQPLESLADIHGGISRGEIAGWSPPSRLDWSALTERKALAGAIVPEADKPAQKKKALGSGDHQQNTGEEADGWEGKRRRDGAAK